MDNDFLDYYLHSLDIMIRVNEHYASRNKGMFKSADGELKRITKLIMLLRKLGLKAEI